MPSLLHVFPSEMAARAENDSVSRHKYKAIGLRLDEQKRHEVQAMADAERRSLAMMCAILIEEALQARKEK